MRQFAKSMMSAPLAASMFGMQQMLNLARLGGEPSGAEQVAGSMTRFSTSTASELRGVLRTVYDVTHSLQDRAVDMFFDTPLLNPTDYTSSMLELASPIVKVFSATIPGGDLVIRWEELQNKFEIFTLVRAVSKELGVPANATAIDLPALVDKSYEMGEFPSLWAIEGLGHEYADTFYHRGEVPHAIMHPDKTGGIDDGSLTMLHAGIGLAFAQRLLKQLKPSSPMTEVRTVVQQFLDLVYGNSRSGYEGCALESLGLVSRVFERPLFELIDRTLANHFPEEVLGFFWHGAGRGNYFGAEYFLPCPGIPFKSIVDSAPHHVARENLLAGLAWAITLVNMRQPIIMENLLRLQGTFLSSNDWFANGVASSLVMRNDTTPNASVVSAYCSHTPSGDEETGQIWDKIIRSSCTTALQQYYPTLKAKKRLGEVFRYQDLANQAS